MNDPSSHNYPNWVILNKTDQSRRNQIKDIQLSTKKFIFLGALKNDAKLWEYLKISIVVKKNIWTEQNTATENRLYKKGEKNTHKN